MLLITNRFIENPELYDGNIKSICPEIFFLHPLHKFPDFRSWPLSDDD
ncbi:hypothetical protein LEP1GSC050_2451 [Leptospira broomii serovar Hurstbridge str. 5399]|uniref:Uncharacterized protein n=1 Tax=Leptospira broomii serovar Hurstbridge str. 5399 TaxID=1049789 RepID=T0F9W6_9LEPT|nr:hypothetical protein LEP1GSC050_2451 [Leptospira broomii serovar Hurstbridge str. 5399]